MSLKSPYPTKIGRGAYSAIVFKNGDLIVAEDNVGTVIQEDSNAATVIQAAIDSCNGKGNVALMDVFDTTVAITFPSGPWTSYSKGITLQGSGVGSGVNYTPSTGYAIKMEGQAGASQCAHHLLDNLIISAPNTTDAAIGILGGVIHTDLRGIHVYNCPNGKGIYINHSATLGGNVIHMSNIDIYKSLYGIYAAGGPSLSIDGRSYIRTLTADAGKEALYYTVDGYAGSGFKQLYTENLEICAEAAAQRSMYIKGDTYFISEHHNLYDDIARPIYLDGGRHQFHSCYLGDVDWSVGTLVDIDKGSSCCFLKAKDPLYCPDEFNTPLMIDTSSPFSYTTGSFVADGTAANGKVCQLNAHNEVWGLYFYTGTNHFHKYIGRGKYILSIYAKDYHQVVNDLKVYVQTKNGGGYTQTQIATFTVQGNFSAIPYLFTLDSDDLAENTTIILLKNTTTTNTISIDYLSLQRVGSDFHQSLTGGYQFVHFRDTGTLPSASKNYKGEMGFQAGSSGNADTVKMCMKSAGGSYSWKTVVTG